MNADEDELERGGDDTRAAEYVLGVLDREEREATARRIETDAAFARLVDDWEVRLSPLADGYQPAEPPPALKAALDARLFGQPAAQAPAPSGFMSALAFWRSLAVVSMAALIALALWSLSPWMQPSGIAPAERLVASLASDETDVRYLVVYDGAKGEIAMSHVTGDRAEGRDFELWLVGGDQVRSLGVVPVGASVQLAVEDDLRPGIASGAQFAISLEPLGGSPEPGPTGPVVAAGDLRAI
jgi:anti-sigma-K factor RskA